MKIIRLTAHALSYTEKRGFIPAEVEETIQKAEWQNSNLGKLECQMDFPYNDEWNGKHYETKQIRPIFVDEENEIVVITVYTYYF